MTGVTEFRDIIERHSNNLRDEIGSFLEALTGTYELQGRSMESELKQSKMLAEYFEAKRLEVEDRLRQKEDELRRTEDKLEKLENVIKAKRRIVCLIDGDGCIFSISQIRRGYDGGLAVAQKLTDAIHQHYPSPDCDLHIWVYFNKCGLAGALGTHGKDSAKNNLERFMHGFNQACERYLMVDIGYGKDGADTKVRTYLEDEVKSPLTNKVILAGCHDNGYVLPIQSLITNGYKDKLVLLPSYSEIEPKFVGLELPFLNVPDLFEPTKLGAPTSTAPTAPKPVNLNPGKARAGSISEASSLKSSSAWSSVVQQQTATPVYKRGSTPPGHKSRHIDPSKPLSKQDPPPCNLFYLTDSCKRGSMCYFAHDYIISAENLEEMRDNAKKSPCTSTIQSGACTYGDKCCFGHKCPQGPGCWYRQQGTCKFIAAGMHTAE